MWKIACEDVVRLYCETYVHRDQLDIQKISSTMWSKFLTSKQTLGTEQILCC